MKLFWLSCVLLGHLARGSLLPSDALARLQVAHAQTRSQRLSNSQMFPRSSASTANLRSRSWSGGVIADTLYKSITAEMIIPNVTFPDGYNASATYMSSVWVGISGFGDLCQWNDCAVWQTGFYYMYDPEGDFGVYPFYEWWPNPPVFVDDRINISVGDHVRMTITQQDNTTGTATFEDITTGQSVTINNGTAPSGGVLDSSMAEWIVETFMTEQDDSTLYPDYGSLTWTNIEAVADNGTKVPLSQAGPVNAEPLLNGKFLSNCTVDAADASTTCKWQNYKAIFP